jgi:hypothetical protein
MMKRLNKVQQNRKDPNFQNITIANLAKHLSAIEARDIEAGALILNWFAANEIDDPDFKDPDLRADDPGCSHSQIENTGALIVQFFPSADGYEYLRIHRDYVRALGLARDFCKEHNASAAA